VCLCASLFVASFFLLLNAEAGNRPDGGGGVNATVAVVVVGEGVVGDATAGVEAAEGGGDTGVGGAGDGVVDLVVAQAGVGAEDEGHDTGNGGAGHGGAGEGGVEVVTRAAGAADGGTGGANVGLNGGEAGGSGAGAAAAEPGQGVVVVSGTNTDDGVHVAGGVGSAAVGASVALGEDGDHTGIAPGVNVGAVPVVTVASTPRVGNDISAEGAVGSGAVKAGRADDVLGGAGKVSLAAEDGSAALGGEPLDAGGHTHSRGLRAGDGAHGVGAVAIAVSGGGGAARVVPVVVVVKGAVGVSTVVANEGSVGVPHTGVNVGDDNAGAVSDSPGGGSLL